MKRFIFLIFSLIIIKNISSFDTENIYSSFINPSICMSAPPNDINCFYEINIWYYVPSNINKIYFLIPLEQDLSEVNLYIGDRNKLSNMKLIEKSSEFKYEISREKDNLYVVFIKEQDEDNQILINHYYSDNINSNMDIKTLRLSFYKNYPIELMSDPAPQSCLSFYDYENDPDKIYLISNNNYFIYYISSNSSSINYNTEKLQYLDRVNINNYYEYKIYKNGNYYYLISKIIFIKIEKKEKLLVLTDISTNNEKFVQSKIDKDANVNNLEQIEFSNGEIIHLYFIRNEQKICSIEYGCTDNNINDITYISFYYDGECFLVKNEIEIYRCSFKVGNNVNNIFQIGSKLNNQFIEGQDYIYQIKVFSLDENNTNFLLCVASVGKSLFCIVFNYNSIGNDLDTKNFFKVSDDINDIKTVNVFPYRSNNIIDNNLIIIVSKNQYSIIDINNNISITGKQLFKFDGTIGRDTSFYDLGNNKFIITYSSGNNILNANIGIDMGTIPKRKKILKIIEVYQEFLEIPLKELFDENEKLSNNNYKVIFLRPNFYTEDSSFNPDNIKFFYNNKNTNLKFYDNNNPEYEINTNIDSQKIIIKLTDYTFNILLNYTIIGEQLASKNLIKIMNKPKCHNFCLTCDYEYSHLSDINNHYCDICNSHYEYFLKIENSEKSYINCYTDCFSNNLFFISGEKECYKTCPGSTPYYIKSIYQCFPNCPNGYYQYENSFECNNVCPNSYFIDNKNKKCTKVCPENYYGDGNSKLCVQNCPNDFYKNNVNHLCEENCPGSLLVDIKNKICLIKCQGDLYEDSLNKKCVENCPENYYKDKSSYKCVSKCPEGYYENNDYYVCLKNCKEGFKRDVITDNCVLNIISEENKNPIIDLNNNNKCIILVQENYMDLIDSKEIYECNTLKIQILPGDNNSMDISKELAKENNMASLDINNCLEYIITHNRNLTTKDELIIIIIENQTNTSLIDNFNFYIYDLNNNKINLQICKQNNISISISKSIFLDESQKERIKYYKDKHSIDITNPNEDCFNDICIPMQTENGLDLSMEYRRTKIYIENICGQNVEYEINYNESIIKCFVSDYNDNVDFLNNNNNFITQINNNNFKMIKCYNLVFDYSKAIKNIANWIILCLFIIKCLFLVLYLLSSVSSIESFLGYWQIFKGTNEVKDINIVNTNNNFLQTLQTENNESDTKTRNNSHKKSIKNRKNIMFETLPTLTQSVSVRRQSNNNNINNNDAAPPKKRRNQSIDDDRRKLKHNKSNFNNSINMNINKKKKEEKEFCFEKTEQINYTKYIDKDDDVISDGCYPVVMIDYEKILKKEEEERRKKEEEERKIREGEEERLRKEEAEEKKKKEEEKKKIQEEKKRKKEEKKRRKKRRKKRKKRKRKKKKRKERQIMKKRKRWEKRKEKKGKKKEKEKKKKRRKKKN